jgi:hypothetical protein
MTQAGHPRRRTNDAIDVGFRMSIAVFGTWLWAFIVLLMYTSTLRGTFELVLALCGGVPLFAVDAYAFLTMRAFFDDRLWARAERMANDTVEDPGPGTTSV